MTVEVTTLSVPDGKPTLVLAEYDTPGACMKAAEKLRDAGFTSFDTHTPFPVHGMDAAMGLTRSKLPWLVFFGGITGTTTAFLLEYVTQAVIYKTVVQAKPATIMSLPAWFPVMFELTILFSAFTVLFGLLALIGLPRWNHPLFTSKRFGRFSDDGLFVCIEARDPKFSQEGTKTFLEGIGAKNIELVEDDI